MNKFTQELQADLAEQEKENNARVTEMLKASVEYEQEKRVYDEMCAEIAVTQQTLNDQGQAAYKQRQKVEALEREGLKKGWLQ